jgi:hypothetical protein
MTPKINRLHSAFAPWMAWLLVVLALVFVVTMASVALGQLYTDGGGSSAPYAPYTAGPVVPDAQYAPYTAGPVVHEVPYAPYSEEPYAPYALPR